MPQFDKTGPMGNGPRTGRGFGACGQGQGRGFGCGRGLGRRRFNALSSEEKKALLKTEIDDLKEEVELAEKELRELENE